MDLEFVKWLTTLGIGGILAAFMFTFYRKDIKQFTELWKSTTENLTVIVKENTASNIKLVNMIEIQERTAIRREDIAILLDRKSQVPRESTGS